MNRRNFLEKLGIGATTIALAPHVLTAIETQTEEIGFNAVGAGEIPYRVDWANPFPSDIYWLRTKNGLNTMAQLISADTNAKKVEVIPISNTKYEKLHISVEDVDFMGYMTTAIPENQAGHPIRLDSDFSLPPHIRPNKRIGFGELECLWK